jgi:hypothetical protein
MNSPLTSRDIAAMTAHAAGIKAENDAYTQGRLRAGLLICGQEVERNRLFNSDGELIAILLSTTTTSSESDARRLAACWNACAGAPTETLELAASWGDIVKGVMGGARISAEAAAVGAALDSESLEQGEVL